MSRHLKDIDESKVAELAFTGCHTRTIARIMSVDESTLRDRFPALIAQKRAERRVWLLELQNALANKGDRTMLVWLGKQVLEQKEKQEITGDTLQPLCLIIEKAVPPEVE